MAITRKYVSLLFIVCLLAQYSTAQNWYRSIAPHGRDISTSAIINGRTFILGGGFEVAETFEDWFITNDYAIVGGGWNVEPVDTPSSRVMSMAFRDSLNGYGVCYLGKMVRTLDGGQSWHIVDTAANKNFFKVIYATPQTLFIVGGSRGRDTSTIFKSSDGGGTWTIVHNQPGNWLKSICFLDALNGFAVGDNSQILATTNGGNNWSPVAAPIAGRSLNDIVFLTSTTGYIVGGVRDTTVTLLKTINSGQTWSVVRDQSGGMLNDITFLNSSEGYIVGDSATLLKTMDGGQNWVQETLPNTTNDQRLNTVTFYDSHTGVIGGAGAYVAFYTFSALPEAITGSAVLMPDTVTGALYADINTHGYQGSYTFIYSTDSTFATASGGAYPDATISDSLLAFSYNAGPLIRDTTYYYLVIANTLAGTVYGQKRSFFTHLPSYTFKSLPPEVAGNHATIKGMVDNLPASTNLYFEYGTSWSLGYTIPANAATIGAGQRDTVSAVINPATPFVRYYYRLKGVSGNETYYSDINSFTTGVAVSVLQTLQATNVSTDTVTLNGLVDKCALPATLSFEYDTNPQFFYSLSATPAFINDTLEHTVVAYLVNPLPLTQYYYRIKAHTWFGDYFGQTMSFIPRLYTDFQTLPATNVTDVSVTLNGTVDKFALPVNLSFDYGTNPGNLEHNIPASPNIVGDTLQHSVSATVGLLPNAEYYFRLKAQTSLGEITGNMLKVSVIDASKNSMKVYPNPCNGVLFVELAQGLTDESKVQFFDLNGKLCRQLTLPAFSRTTSFSTQDFQKGPYVVRIIAGKQRFAQKVLLLKEQP